MSFQAISRVFAVVLVSSALAVAGCSGEDEENATTPQNNVENNDPPNDVEPPLDWGYPDPYADGDEVDWVVDTEATYARLPAVDEEGGLVYGDWNGVVRRVDADTGDVTWSFDAAGRIDTAPAIDDDGQIYIGDWTGVIYGLDADGEQLWSHDVGAIVDVSPSIGADGDVWVGDDAGFLHRFSPQGDLEESIDIEAPVTSAVSISVDTDGWIAYVGAADDSVHCIDDEGEHASVTLPGTVSFDIAVAAGGDALVSTDDGGVARIDTDCGLVWEEDLTWAVLMPAAVTNDDSIWVWGHNRQIYHIDADTGSTVHQEGAPIRGNATTAPTVADDGRILVASQGVVYFEGEESGIISEIDAMDSPVLVDDAAIVTVERGAAIRLAGTWPSIGDSPWPTQHGNLARTGRVEQ